MSRRRKLLNLFFASTLAASAGLLLFNVTLDRAMRGVIAAAPLPMEAQIMDWQRCVLDVMGRQDADTNRCPIELTGPSGLHGSSFITNAPAEIARARQELSALWFVLAGLSFPFSFGSAGILGFLLFRE